MNYNSIKQNYLKNNYVFRTEKMRLNIFGIRSKNSKSDKFDDLGGVAWIDEDGKEQLFNFWMTTDPGKYWLQNPMNKDGCIIMVPGQYLECYARGLHSGKYDALVQVAKMHYVRDNDKNTDLDFSLYRDPVKLAAFGFWGMNGTNFHRASEWKIVDLIFNWSAGCQVVQRPETFKKIMDLRDESIIAGWKKFDYTLFEE